MSKLDDDTMRGTPDTAHPTELALYHLNPKRGDTAAIEASLMVNSQYRPLTVNLGTHTGRPMEVLKGNHTLTAIRNLAERKPDDPRWQTVQIWQVDVDDDRAARIVVADNRTHAKGTTNEEKLLALLEPLDDLDGTGYDLDDLKALRGDSGDTGPEANFDWTTGEDDDDDGSPWDDAPPAGEGNTLTDVRQIILPMVKAQYDPLVDQLDRLREHYGVDTYTAVVDALIADLEPFE